MLFWISWVRPKCNSKYLYEGEAEGETWWKRRRHSDLRGRAGSDVDTKECWRLLEAARDRNGTFSRASEESVASETPWFQPSNADFRLLVSKTGREDIPVVLNHQAGVVCYSSDRKLIEDPGKKRFFARGRTMVEKKQSQWAHGVTYLKPTSISTPPRLPASFSPFLTFCKISCKLLFFSAGSSALNDWT